MILEFINVEKSFGAKKVLKGVNFTAKSGVANGYLGRNGSGKTTSFRILLDIFKPDKGQNRIPTGRTWNVRWCRFSRPTNIFWYVKRNEEKSCTNRSKKMVRVF